MVQNKVILRQNYTHSDKLGSERSERASKQMSAVECASKASSAEQTNISERCMRTSKQMSELIK